ncbi:alginate lyase family protein [Telluribacter humicola]|uniref:alginate lyase family protein n=1 Tax=Telluribacter humicola TaxID=1720261 RepID=UPI001A96AE00|nr:alginate lyase family protein [Telluribacter humicola]
MKHYPYLAFLLLLSFCAEAQVRQTLLLTARQQREVKTLVKTNPEVQALWKPVEQEAKQYLNDEPRPLRVIHYEGLLDTNPDRIRTTESLKDLDKVAVWLSAYYGTQDAVYANKIKEYLLAWAGAYQPTGNPINENKLEPLVHSYQVLKEYFSTVEKRQVDKWLTQLAEAEMAFPRIPENNWKAKHIKLVGTIGLVLQKPHYVEYAQEKFKKYIDKALYADGTSRDLIERDALSYHVSGLDPLLIYALTVEQLGGKQGGFRPFTYESPEGGSIQKSIDYVVPYAKREKVHAEWVNTKVELDRQRAKAGLEHYQPGKPYNPEGSLDMFTLASYFNPAYREVIKGLKKEDFKEYNSWLSVLVAR